VLIFGVPVLFLHSGARGVGGPVCKLGGRASFKGGVFGFASVVVFWRKVNTLFFKIIILRSSGIKTKSVSEMAKGYPPGLRLL
jgi:hypothetical protein